MCNQNTTEEFTKMDTVKSLDKNKLLFSTKIFYQYTGTYDTYLLINAVIDCKVFSFAVSSSSNNSYLSKQLKESVCENVKNV